MGIGITGGEDCVGFGDRSGYERRYCAKGLGLHSDRGDIG